MAVSVDALRRRGDRSGQRNTRTAAAVYVRKRGDDVVIEQRRQRPSC
jgi:hypothetical protein